MAPFKSHGVDIVDIRRETLDDALLNSLMNGINPENDKPKSMPTLLLYDERGLRLFERITYLEEYYLTNSEISVLEKSADHLAGRISNGSRIIELGSGNLRKVAILLKAFERARKHVEYYALDLSLAELSRTFTEVSTEDYAFVKFFALHGTYDDGLAWLTEHPGQPTVILSLGSSIGNFSRAEAAEFLASFAKSLGPVDTLIVGLDACQDQEKVYKAYNDSKGVTEWFYRNGLDHANILLGAQAFKQSDWAVEGSYNEEQNKHEAYYVAQTDVQVGKSLITKGERLKFEESFKYSEAESDELWHAAGLVPQISYGNEDKTYHVHVLAPSQIQYSKIPHEYAQSPVPSLANWRQLWTTWDVATKSMVPRDELMNKPIKLRNNLIFYLGHIPTFADIHMTKATKGSPTDPAYYMSIFERGIDPDVDNPEQCHAHSEIPDTWPPLADILDYQARVRERIIDLIYSGKAVMDRKVSRGLWLAYEHEAMHLETFLYMLLQSERVLSPPGVPVPDFEALAREAKSKRVENQWHSIPETEIILGLDDPENNLGPDRYFGWDNERPSRKLKVMGFEAQSRPISNGDYAHFLEATHNSRMPASWVVPGSTIEYANGHVGGATDGGRDGEVSKIFLKGKVLRTVFGQVPLEYALDWPVMASYDELAAFAKWSDGRIPTLEEAKSIYSYAEEEKAKVEKIPSKLISAVNGHLCLNGVEESPPAHPSSNGAGAEPDIRPDPNTLFIDLNGANVGFAHWHPTPVTHITEVCGQSAVGGLWEWTSSNLAPHPGFKAMDLYPGYTADFFDGKHNICLGGSWATIPRIAGRKSFVNWYQRNYPYVWCTARLVRDAKN